MNFYKDTERSRGHKWLAVLFGVVLLLSACSELSSPGEVPVDIDTEANATAEGLLVSSASNRAGPRVLDGALVKGVVYIFTAETEGIKKVDFYLDDPERSGAPRRTETRKPYDFASTSSTGAKPFDTSKLSDGMHVVTAAIFYSSGKTEVVSAKFLVDNGGKLGDSLLVSKAPSRLDAKPLAGSKLSGDAYVFVIPEADTQQVDFYLDDPERSGKPHRTERYVFYDFAATAADGSARAFSVDRLSEGTHTITAVISLARGQKVVKSARFTVVDGRAAPAPEPSPAPSPSPSPAPDPTPSPKPGVLWSAAMETGDMSEWYNGGGEFNNGGGTSGVSTAVARSGRYAAEMRLTDVRSNQGVRLFRWAESRQHPELYYSAWYYFPRRYAPKSWWNVFQFKSKVSESKNDPFFVLNVSNRADGQMYFYLYDAHARRSYSGSPLNIPTGRWVHVEAYYKSRGDKTGQITVWQDGTEILNVSGVQTRYPDGDTQWSVSNYTDGITPDDVVTYVDDAAISTARVGAQEILAAGSR